MTDSRAFAPSAERNREWILQVLRGALPESGTVLEVGSGTGQHVAHFAAALPGLTWQPSDRDAGHQGSVAAWVAEAGLTNVLPPLRLDARELPWPIERADAIVCCNVIHISPWETCVSLFAGARSVLEPGAPLFLYGPYTIERGHVSESNLTFDGWLRSEDPAWGVRDLEDVRRVAEEHGFALDRRVPTPRNNQSLVFRRA